MVYLIIGVKIIDFKGLSKIGRKGKVFGKKY